jgi:hypothetical protein
LFILSLAFLSSRNNDAASFLPRLSTHGYVPFDLLGPHDAQELTKQGPNLGRPVGDWEFDVNLDGRDFGLSDEQCDAAFPDYYHEIERAAAWRQEQNLPNIQENQMDISWRDGEIIRLMIYDRQVSVLTSYCQEQC